MAAWFGWSGGYGEGKCTRSHLELGRESPQRRWYCVLRRGRVGRCQASQASRYTPLITCLYSPPDAGWSSPVARQAHNLKVAGSNPAPATIPPAQQIPDHVPGARHRCGRAFGARPAIGSTPVIKHAIRHARRRGRAHEFSAFPATNAAFAFNRAADACAMIG